MLSCVEKEKDLISRKEVTKTDFEGPSPKERYLLGRTEDEANMANCHCPIY